MTTVLTVFRREIGIKGSKEVNGCEKIYISYEVDQYSSRVSLDVEELVGQAGQGDRVHRGGQGG